MIKWLTEVCDVPTTKIRARVYTHRYCDVDPERFWQEVTQLPRAQFRRTIYKATPHAQPKNPSFKGCCRLEVSGVQFLAMIKEWQSLLLQRFLGATGGDSHILPPTAAMYSTPASRRPAWERAERSSSVSEGQLPMARPPRRSPSSDRRGYQ